MKPQDTLISSGLYKLLILELILNSMFIPPNLDYKFTGKMLGGKYVYSVDDLMVVISLAKCYLILRLYYHYSKWTSEKIKRITKQMKIKNTYIFPIKCELKYRPFSFLLFVSFVTVVFVSIIIRVVEM